MQFTYTALTWGFLLALVPLIIHLINLMRHRRVQWAAMEFLLESYRKHRKWVWLRQLILLLMRMVAIGLLVAMLAKLVTQNQWAIFGGNATHHYVLLDDSFSMSERTGAESGFTGAIKGLKDLTDELLNMDGAHRITVIRYSRALLAQQAGSAESDKKKKASDETDDAKANRAVAQVADIHGQAVTRAFRKQLEEQLKTFEVTQLAVQPQRAIELVNKVLQSSQSEKAVVHLFSDFRKQTWDTPQEIRAALRNLEQLGSEVHLVDSVHNEQPNLAIVGISPVDETRAAGVPLYLKVDVKNMGQKEAINVQMKVRTTSYNSGDAQITRPGMLKGTTTELDTVSIDRIDAGKTASRRIQVRFLRPGEHVVEAELQEDAVEADNRRWAVVNIPAHEAVLIIDGSLEQKGAYFIRTAFQPGGRTNTGVQCTTQGPSFLRDSTLEDLQKFKVIYVTDIDRLDERSVRNLENYTKAGGGVAMFVGDNTNIRFYNERLYRDGKGIFPLPLLRDDLLPPATEATAADLDVTDHPILKVFLDKRNPMIRTVSVYRYLRPPEDWEPATDSTIDVIVRLRNRQPLVIERKFGEGRVLACLTALNPSWSNWAKSPSFIVLVLKSQSYLSQRVRQDTERLVGSSIELNMQFDVYNDEVEFVRPGVPTPVKLNAKKPSPDSPIHRVVFGANVVNADATQSSGIYEAWMTNRLTGNREIKRFALNVDAREGEVALSDSKSMLASLSPVKAQYRRADQTQVNLLSEAGQNWSLLFMGILVFLLLVEQVMAYFASYHPAARGGATT